MRRESVVMEVEGVTSLYDLEEELGEGSFACVWRASVRGKPEEQVAIKQVHVHPLQKEMAYRQVQNLEKVDSDHIIKYYSSLYDTSDSTLNLIMELCRGSLRRQLPQRVFSRNELLSFIVQMNSAFLELLDKKLMHLDLKPQNILVSKSSPSCYKICDFGCAQMAVKSKLSKYDNQIFGTFNYLAPENYLSYHGKLTNTSADIWSLGIILYEMIYKRLPFELGPDGLIQRQAIQQYFEGKQDKITYELSPKAPPEVVQLVKKMLKPLPKNRITWMGLKEELMGKLGVDEHAFFNTKKIYFRHLRVTKVFLTFVVMLRKDSELNPHPFWCKNGPLLTEMAQTLIHLSHLFSLKFHSLYSYKLSQFLDEEWVSSLDFMRGHIQLEQAALAAKKQQKMADLSDLPYYQEVLRNCAREVQAQLGVHQEYWVSMQNLDVFCQQTIRRGQTRKSFFASGDNETYGQTMKALDIQ